MIPFPLIFPVSYTHLDVYKRQENDNCLVLPLQCVRTVTQEDGSTVNVVFVKGSRPDNAIETPTLSEEIPEGFWAVPVEIGISDNSNVEIKSGVEAVSYTHLSRTVLSATSPV